MNYQTALVLLLSLFALAGCRNPKSAAPGSSATTVTYEDIQSECVRSIKASLINPSAATIEFGSIEGQVHAAVIATNPTDGLKLGWITFVSVVPMAK